MTAKAKGRYSQTMIRIMVKNKKKENPKNKKAVVGHPVPNDASGLYALALRKRITVYN